jgi:hypothetical protein
MKGCFRSLSKYFIVKGGLAYTEYPSWVDNGQIELGSLLVLLHKFPSGAPSQCFASTVFCRAVCSFALFFDDLGVVVIPVGLAVSESMSID